MRSSRSTRTAIRLIVCHRRVERRLLAGGRGPVPPFCVLQFSRGGSVHNPRGPHW